MSREKITIKPFSATVVELEGNWEQLPPNLVFSFYKKLKVLGGDLLQEFTVVQSFSKEGILDIRYIIRAPDYVKTEDFRLRFN